MKSLAECRLYGFVDSAYLHGREPAVLARLLCEGGVDIIQLRAKDWSREQVRRVAGDLLRVTRNHGVRLVINDHHSIASEVGAEVCHLGQEDFFDAGYSDISDLRGAVGFAAGQNHPLEIGLSTHSSDQAVRALRAGPDYIAIGPVFATGTKPTARPVTLDYVKWAAGNVSIPWFAIGGINLSNLGDVLEAGARRVCVVSAILNATDVSGECRRYRDVVCGYPLA